MTNSTPPAEPPYIDARDKHPKGLYVLFLTEMWERFSFYLMIGIFQLYLTDTQTGGLGWSSVRAASLVGTYIGLVYLSPFLGGLLADRVLGYRKSVLLGGVAFVIGHVLLAFPSEAMLYLALLFLVIGNGLFKPNISTMVGRLYPDGSKLRDKAYTIFYMGINIGAFVCNFVAAVVRNKYGWHWAFATAGFGMLLGLLIFILGQRHLRHVDIAPRSSNEPKESLRPLWVECSLPAVMAGVIGWFVGKGPNLLRLGATTTAFVFACLPVVFFYYRIWQSLEEQRERNKTAALLSIFGVVVVFWMVFHQNATALTSWAQDNTDRRPGALIQPVVNLAPDFAEHAPPTYFVNASPSTPRPSEASLRIVSDEEYKVLAETNKVFDKASGIWSVTAALHRDIYKHADPKVPTFPADAPMQLVNTELFQSINGGFVMLLAPVMVLIWTLLARRNREPSTPAKIGFGLTLTAASALVMVGAVAVAGGDGLKVSAWWLVGTYLIITFGELCLSPMGLSLVSKHAPKKISGFMMGGWFLSTAIGNKLSGVFGEVYHVWDHTTFFIVNTIAAGSAGLAIFLLLPWLRRQLSDDPGVR